MAMTVLLVIVALMLAAETVGTLTPVRQALERRWLGNLTLYVCNVVTVKLFAPASAAAGAMLAAEHDLGIFNTVAAPAWLVAVATFVALDFVGYLTHRIEHTVPLLWRMHRVHHSDPDLDVTTGLRFHPVEVLTRGSVSALAMLLLGAPVAVVALSAVLYGMISLVSHVNAPLLPGRVENTLNSLLVTPRVHRIHHSREPSESNSNFGVALSIWDRMLGTYRAQPALPFDQMRFGVEERTNDDSLSIAKILMDPVLAK